MTLAPEVMLTRLLLAAGLSALVGAERERGDRGAGLRTHALVGVGSCLFMLVSAFGMADVLRATHAGEADLSRIAAQVASGVGFLGAGTIILRRNKVRGLTTAASIWVVAATGLAVGAGLYTAAVGTTALTVLVLGAVKPLERRLFKVRREARLRILVGDGEAMIAPVLTALDIAGLPVLGLQISRGRQGETRLDVAVAQAEPGRVAHALELLRDAPGFSKAELQ